MAEMTAASDEVEKLRQQVADITELLGQVDCPDCDGGRDVCRTVDGAPDEWCERCDNQFEVLLNPDELEAKLRAILGMERDGA